MEQLKVYPAIGVCGLDCGLCPRYYTAGPSKCPGCGGPDFRNKHPSCSFITCCVKKRGLEVCGQCADFPCAKFRTEDEYGRAESSSYPPYRKTLPNLRFIREEGIGEFIKRQRQRIALLETMIENCDEGRSKSFYCRAAALLDPKSLKAALDSAKVRSAGCGASDRARVLREILERAAVREEVELRRK